MFLVPEEHRTGTEDARAAGWTVPGRLPKIQHTGMSRGLHFRFI